MYFFYLADILSVSNFLPGYKKLYLLFLIIYITKKKQRTKFLFNINSAGMKINVLIE